MSLINWDSALLNFAVWEGQNFAFLNMKLSGSLHEKDLIFLPRNIDNWTEKCSSLLRSLKVITLDEIINLGSKKKLYQLGYYKNYLQYSEKLQMIFWVRLDSKFIQKETKNVVASKTHTQIWHKNWNKKFVLIYIIRLTLFKVLY